MHSRPRKKHLLVRVEQGGASGGMQGGPRRGRSPITGPALPPPEAAQTTEKDKPPCPQGTQAASQRTNSFLLSFRAPDCNPTPTEHNPRIERPAPKFKPFIATSLSSITSAISETFYSTPTPPISHSTRRRTMALRGAKEAPEAAAAQPSWDSGIWKALEG